MNHEARQRILASPWEPKTYNPQELSQLLGISVPEARGIIRDINGSSAGFPCLPWVTHQDLVPYLRDVTSIAEVPSSREQMSVYGDWLISERGWGLDLTRKVFRWIDPNDQERRLTLSHALRIEMVRLRKEDYPEEFDEATTEEEAIEVEFEVKGQSSPSN